MGLSAASTPEPMFALFGNSATSARVVGRVGEIPQSDRVVAGGQGVPIRAERHKAPLVVGCCLGKAHTAGALAQQSLPGPLVRKSLASHAFGAHYRR